MDTDRFLSLLRSIAALPPSGAVEDSMPASNLANTASPATCEDSPASEPASPTANEGREDEGGREQPRSGAATAVRPAPARPAPDVLPPWRVVLHNDDHNDMDHVVESIMRVVRLNRPSATRCMVEAHRKGCCQVVATHREKAEFLAEQLRSYRLTVTIEPVR
jgi:ATP-dependent Clp protease adaptor protein ClpS